MIGVNVTQPQQQGTILFSNTENDVRSYPHYFRTFFIVEDNSNLNTRLRVKFDCQGLSSTTDAWFSYRLFFGNVSVFDVFHDPDNATVRWEMSEHGLLLRFSSSTNLAFGLTSDEIPDFTLAPGQYVWTHYIKSSSHITADTASVTVLLVHV